MANPSAGISNIIKTHYRVYPNPASQKVSIDLGATNLKSIQLYTINGQLLRDIEVTETKIDIEKGSLPNGLYILKMGNTTAKIIFE